MVSEIMVINILRGHFGNYQMNRIWSANRYCINRVYVLCKYGFSIFFKGWYKKILKTGDTQLIDLSSQDQILDEAICVSFCTNI